MLETLLVFVVLKNQPSFNNLFESGIYLGRLIFEEPPPSPLSAISLMFESKLVDHAHRNIIAEELLNGMEIIKILLIWIDIAF